MHVKRHFNRLFGSFRASESKSRVGVWVGAGGPSRWELANHEHNVDEISPKIDQEFGKNLETPDFLNADNGKKPSLLKRTWSSKRRKGTNHKTLEENTCTKIELEHGLADVVQEINATIGMMNEYTLLHHHHNHPPEIDQPAPTDNRPMPQEAQFSDSNNYQNIQNFDVLDFEPNWEYFDGTNTQDTSVDHDDDQMQNKMFLHSLEENANIIGNAEEDKNHPSNYAIFERPNYTLPSQPISSTLRRSGRRLYNTLTRRGRSSRGNDNQDGPQDQLPNGNNFVANGSSWVTRSFRRVLRRKPQLHIRGSSSNPDLRCGDNLSNPNEAAGNNGVGTMVKKRLTAFGRSMMAASTVMPLDFEHPSYPQDSLYPQAYYEEDEEAIYEFRRYCEQQEWNKVHWNQHPQPKEVYRVGYCS